MDLDRQVMILDIGALMSIVGVSWMTQYLEEFDLTIYEMKSVECQQPFRFGPSKIYISKTLIVTRLDGREDILVVQRYLVDAEVPFLCGKRILESWNFKIDRRSKILKIESKIDSSRKEIKMVDTQGGHCFGSQGHSRKGVLKKNPWSLTSRKRGVCAFPLR